MIKIISNKWPIWWFGAGAITFFNFIFINKEYYNSLSDIEKNALIKHETLHLERQNKEGILWYVKYAINKDFRLNEELIAFSEEIKYLISEGKDKKLLIDQYAQFLSSKTYMNMVSDSTAKDLLEKLIG